VRPDSASHSPLRWLVLALLAIGVALRVWQYLGDMSLWFDELSIARNVYERTLGELMTEPLGYDQIAPLGFLAMVKGSALLAGPTDLALRLFPFLCGLLSLVLFWRVAERVLHGIAVPFAVALFALGLPFIRYSAELKQYGPDVAVTLALTWIALDLRAAPQSVRRCIMAGLAGFVIVWFSQTAVLVMAGLGTVLAARWLMGRDPSARLPTLVTVPLWAMASLLGTWVARRHTTPEILAYMHQFWKQRLGFFPLPPRHAHDALWLWDRIVQLFADDTMLKYPLPWLYAAIAAAGIVALWRQRRDVALIIVAPLVVTVAAAVAQQYPFRARLVVFLIPSLVLMAAAGVQWIAAQAARAHPLLGTAVVPALAAPPVYAIIADPPPYYIEGYKPVLAYVQAHRRTGDAVYVYANAYEAVVHYGARYGLEADGYILGICDERESRRYLEDVDRFRGRQRVWVIASSVAPFYPARQSIDRYLHAIGVQRDSIAIPSRRPIYPVSAELFDLSDSTRLRTTTAAAFPVTPINDTLPPRCNDRVRPTAGRPVTVSR